MGASDRPFLSRYLTFPPPGVHLPPLLAKLNQYKIKLSFHVHPKCLLSRSLSFIKCIQHKYILFILFFTAAIVQ